MLLLIYKPPRKGVAENFVSFYANFLFFFDLMMCGFMSSDVSLIFISLYIYIVTDQELCGPRPLVSLMVSVDVEHHIYLFHLAV